MNLLNWLHQWYANGVAARKQRRFQQGKDYALATFRNYDIKEAEERLRNQVDTARLMDEYDSFDAGIEYVFKMYNAAFDFAAIPPLEHQ